MDSRILRQAMLCVTLFVITVFLVILAVNGVFDRTRDNGSQNMQEETAEEPIAEDGLISGSDIYAWMGDETFFDEEKIGDGRYEITEEVPVSLMAVSVDRDLRFFITDNEGKLVTGRTFNLSIAGLGEYADSDKDGIIYLTDVSPGQYSVTMGHILGYIEPETPLSVTVNNKIEYKAMRDISYLIKTEADIDASLEDTAISDADADSSGSTAVKTGNDLSFGIDVSKWNGAIDWEAVSREGVEFAIIRCGYRGSSSGSIVVDPYFEQNIQGATAAGIPVGVYFFTQAVNEIEAVEEASAVLSLVRKYDIDYPVFIDSESAGGNGRADGLEAKDRTMALQAFCETIRSGGYDAGVYASKNWFNNRLDISRLSADNVTWLAEYNDKPTYGATYQMWQYSSAGRINGIEGRVDMNVSYLSRDKDADNKKNTQAQTESQEEPERDNNEENKEDGQDNSRNM